MPKFSRALLIAPLCVLLLPQIAVAQDDGAGGYAAPDRPQVAGARCSTEQTWTCQVGERVEVTGKHLDDVRRVVFVGGRGSADDRTAKVLDADEHALTLAVPQGARTGRIVVRGVDGRGMVSRRKMTIVSRPRAASPARDLPAGSFTFPIAGKYTIGREPVQGFGGGRGHKGHDVFADCGTPLVALTDATVQFTATHENAGNYVVLQDAAGRSYAYMHMVEPTHLKRGETVTAGEPVGEVGDSGRASGCHLHFELWTAPGWYEGGEAIDPLPELERWAAGTPPQPAS